MALRTLASAQISHKRDLGSLISFKGQRTVPAGFHISRLSPFIAPTLTPTIGSSKSTKLRLLLGTPHFGWQQSLKLGMAVTRHIFNASDAQSKRLHPVSEDRRGILVGDHEKLLIES